MKHQQVLVDYWTMLKTSCTCLLLALSGYVLIKMVQTIFYLPAYLSNNQKRLEELAAKYNLDLDTEVADADLVRDEIEKHEKENAKNEEDSKESVATSAKADANATNDLNKEPKKLK